MDALVARALKKNPNERFPNAESMRDEALRVASSLHAAPPSIVPGAPAQSGAGVGSAVFPGRPGGPGTHRPRPHAVPAGSLRRHGRAKPPAYGYPQQAGYQPQPSAGFGQQGISTPPPYNLNPPHPTPASGAAAGATGR